jgi:hypothetical protein
MRLYRLTLATIFQHKSWVVCALAVLVLPFVLPSISSASEKPLLVQPARILAAWGTLWFCVLFWGFFTAARHGEENARAGLGEYFLTTGKSATRQLFEIWLAVFTFIVPLTLATAAICQFGATPSNPAEQMMWWVLNLQFAGLFLLVVAPLLCLAIAISSRFGSVSGFAITLGLTLYGLWGVGYLDNMLKLEENPILHALWLLSPHYGIADLTQRLHFKLGALPGTIFWQMILYFGAILAIYTGFSRLCFRIKSI